MISSFVRKFRASLAVAVAALALACGPAVEQPGVPLYPNSETIRLPRSEIAQLAGPIAKIDGKEVVGPVPIVVYALRMKADARYVIRRDVTAGGRYGVRRDFLSAREELPNGDAIDLTPARSADDIRACQA